MQIKWGIAAAGRITHDFVTAIRTICGNNHKIVAVADPEIARAKDFAEKHDIEKYYGGFVELADDCNVDIVYIGTLNPFHYPVARLMLEKGKNVLCEKPICLNYSDAKRLYDLAEEKRLFLMEAMWSRCFPSYKYLNQLIAEGSIGNVQQIHVQHGFKATEVERIQTRKFGGGITLDIGIYTIQLGQMIFKSFPENISASGKLNEDGVDVMSEIVLDYGAGRKLFAKVSGLEDFDNDAVIKGTKGEIKLQNYWCCTTLIESNGSVKNWPLPLGKFEFNHTNACGLRYEAEEVRKCLENGLIECPLYTHKDSLEMVTIEDAVRQKLGVVFNI